METTLHRQLKAHYSEGAAERLEVGVAGFRIDALAADGGLIEVQSGALGPLRGKLARLLPAHRVHIVKPVVVARWLIWRVRSSSPELAARRSPKRGALVDVFDDLIGLARVFPHANLAIDVLGVEIDEVRVRRKRWPGYRVLDRRLRSVTTELRLHEPHDLWSLIPQGLASPFTTRDLANHLARPLDFAQRVAYCLRLSGAAAAIAKRGNHIVYSRSAPRTAIPHLRPKPARAL